MTERTADFDLAAYVPFDPGHTTMAVELLYLDSHRVGNLSRREFTAPKKTPPNGFARCRIHV